MKPGELGVDAMHINLHKTFSTPHGGGGPGAGPVVFSDKLAAFAPVPYVQLRGKQAAFIETRRDAGEGAQPFGRMTAFHGQMGDVRPRALLHARPRGPTACARRRKTRCSTPTTSAPASPTS